MGASTVSHRNSLPRPGGSIIAGNTRRVINRKTIQPISG